MTLVLSLFPGIDLLGRIFEEEGFCVVRGPDLLWGGDIHSFHPPLGKFDGVIGGPPCQAFSSLRHLIRHNGHQVAPNLIPEFERCVAEAQPAWFLMENVTDAPMPSVRGYLVRAQLVNNRWCGGIQNRIRRFSFGTHDGRRLRIRGQALEPAEYRPAVLASGGGSGMKGRLIKARELGYSHREYFHYSCQQQGLPDTFDLPGFTIKGKILAVGNGVPRPLALEIARAVKRAINPAISEGNDTHA